MKSAGKITLIYIISLIYNILIPLLIVRIKYGKCEGECWEYMIPIYMFIFSIFFYISYYFLLNDKVWNNKLLRILIFFTPSILFLILTTIMEYDFHDFMTLNSFIIIPNLVLNFIYFKILT